MGDSEITLARDCTVGTNGRPNMDRFPLTGAYTAYAVHADGTPGYVTDPSGQGPADVAKPHNPNRPSPTPHLADSATVGRRTAAVTISISSPEIPTQNKYENGNQSLN